MPSNAHEELTPTVTRNNADWKFDYSLEDATDSMNWIGQQSVAIG
jgi:hypothetical protein